MTTSLTFDILARDRASDKFDRVGDSASRSSGKLKNFAKVGVLAVAGGAVVATKALFDMTTAAIEDEAAQEKLAKSLKNSAGATDGQVGAVEKWIEAQGKALGVADDELRPALGRLATATGDVGKAQDLTRLAMDISAGTGKSMTTVTEALAKAQNGSLGGLSRLGAATKDAEGKTKSFKQVTEELAQLHGGQAKTAAETTEGKFKRLKVQFDEVKETIGAKLIPVAEKLMDWLMDDFIPAVETFNRNHGPTIKRILGNVGEALRDVARAGKWMWENVLQPTFSTMLSVLAKVARFTADMLEGLSKAPGMGWAAKAADKLRNVADKAEGIDRAIRGIPSYKQVSISINFLYPKGKPTKNLEDTDDWVNDLANPKAVSTAKSATARLMEALADGIKAGGKKLDKVLGESRDRLKTKLGGIRDEMRSLSDSIASALNPDAFSFSDIMQEVDATTGEVTTQAQSALSQMMGQLTGTNSALTNLMSVFGNLRGAVSQGFLSSIMQSGNTSLMQQLAADPAAAAQASALFDANASIAKGLGDETAQAVLGDRIDKALEREMGKLLNELKDAPGKTAKKLRDEIKELRLEVVGPGAGQRAYLRGAH